MAALEYELSISPRASIDTLDEKQPQVTPLPPIPAPPAITPSVKRLFSLLSRKHLCLLALASFTSLISGGIAPFMTFVIGQTFDAYGAFARVSEPTREDRSALLRSVGISAVELISLAVGSVALGSVTSCLWIWIGEINVMTLRKRVFAAVLDKDMGWFDMHTEGEESSDAPVGAGGLMTKFSRETDDVRMASSLASGFILQYLTTSIACLLLAFLRSWQLTLVILSAVPVLIFVQAVSQTVATPLLGEERNLIAVVATVVERALTSITTVKAFNAESYEQARSDKAFARLDSAAVKLVKVWGVSSGISQFVMMGMFVQAFWFGATLIRSGKATTGDVNTVFWACLLSTSNLQMCIPQFITLAKGKFSIVVLLNLIEESKPSNAPLPQPPHDYSPASPVSPNSFATTKKLRRRTLKKITPLRCNGEVAVHNLSFAYPSRPTQTVLKCVSLFLPAHELTFVVGSSGSGKSTLAQIILGMYKPVEGHVSIDEQDVRFLEPSFVKSRVLGVGQRGGEGGVILEGKSLAANVVMGADEQSASMDQIEAACRAALVHEFARDLPNGYETILGGAGGVALSGGQMQRLEIARALLRNPEVLILDEATSALDPTSRILVFEAIKVFRSGRTTIVVTHDLSQINLDDFVYVLKDGQVAEQGYRSDLQEVYGGEGGKGEFRKMMEAQRLTGGFLPEKKFPIAPAPAPVLDLGDETDSDLEFELDRKRISKRISSKHIDLGNWGWMLDVVADLTGKEDATAPMTLALPEKAHVRNSAGRKRPQSIQIIRPDHRALPALQLETIPASPTTPLTRKRLSLPWTPASPTFNIHRDDDWVDIKKEKDEEEEEERQFKEYKKAVQESGTRARQGRQIQRVRLNNPNLEIKTPSSTASKSKFDEPVDPILDTKAPSLWRLTREVYPTIPNKPVFFLGLLICAISGAMTPVFSFLLARLIAQVTLGAIDMSTLNLLGAIVLSVAALDGFLLGSKYTLMEWVGIRWVSQLRSRAFGRSLSQDKTWFDDPSHLPARLVQFIVKDGDDARNLISVVFAQSLVVSAMLGTGIIWALVRGWELTLAGLAVGPVFGVCMMLQARWLNRCERRNKRAREEIGRVYYETLIHIRGIRCMSYEPLFRSQFDDAADLALRTGVRGSFVEGCTYGTAVGLVYFAEAVLFYVGAVLLANGRYTLPQMLEVLNLVVFSVTIGSQLLAFTGRIAKSIQATHDLHELSNISASALESQGKDTPPLSGPISFAGVSFAYPSRPNTTVLRNISLTINPGERVALVGSSGSGKSTVAALIQRLYAPSKGQILWGPNDISRLKVSHLRESIGYVSQSPHLFDATMEENIRYGLDSDRAPPATVRDAAKKALVHDFVMRFESGYEEMLGENAGRLSGGQKQRVMLARALVRDTHLLVLDECTSALDPENARLVVEAIGRVMEEEADKSVVMITHDPEVMRMCDRVVVLDKGEIVEQGSFDELVDARGHFSSLVKGGEWIR